MSTSATLTVDRSQVLAHRAFAHGLHRTASSVVELGLLALGVQDSPPGSARLSFAARLAGPGPDRDWQQDDEIAAAWSVRGAPHIHRADRLPGLAAALWPRDEADAAARLAWNATRVRESGLPALTAIELTAAAVAEVAAIAAEDVGALDAAGLPDTGRLGKGLLSREVTRRLPPTLRRWCEPCRVEHVSEQLLRVSSLPGGLMIAGSAPVDLVPLPGWTGIPTGPVGTGQLVREYLTRYAPATPADVKAFLGSSTAAARACWPDDAVPVTVGDRRAWALPDDVGGLADPPDPPDVRLLPANDAFLKAGDRDVLVPDRAEQKRIWRILGAPGALLLDALPAGTWRAKTSGRRLDVTVTPFAPLPARTVRRVEQEAERVAAVRGLAAGRICVE